VPFAELLPADRRGRLAATHFRVAPVVLDHLEVAARDAPVSELHHNIVRTDLGPVGERDWGRALLMNRMDFAIHRAIFPLDVFGQHASA
jgi:hypothetical protein